MKFVGAGATDCLEAKLADSEDIAAARVFQSQPDEETSLITFTS